MSYLKTLRAEAKALGVKIAAERDDMGWAYWLLKIDGGEPAIEGDSFCTSHSEIEYKLDVIRNQETK